jgi:CheY-like chemotaxis protein
MAAAELPGLILMDMGLPVLDGSGGDPSDQGCGRNEAHPGDRADRQRDDRRQRESAGRGCDDFDTKPVELPRLLGKIQALAPGERHRESRPKPHCSSSTTTRTTATRLRAG